MRQVFIGAILLIGLCEIVSFNRAPAAKTPTPPISPQFWDSCPQCDKDSFYGLTKAEFDSGVAKYQRERQTTINKKYKINDALSCWYSLDTLKKFICLIEKYSKVLKVPPGQLGIRFHYAAYPDERRIRFDSNYAKLHTLFMVPTYADSGTNFDFDPRPRDFGPATQIKPGALRGYRTDYLSGNNPVFALSTQTSNSGPRPKVLNAFGVLVDPGMDQNQGQLCPPTCPR